MDITTTTKELILKMQPLKEKYSDLASQTFIDFYCQCRQGCDYLFPLPIKSSVRLIDILGWFLTCAEKGAPTPLIKLMWQDIIGPTLEEYQEDERIEHNLATIFTQSELSEALKGWDCQRLPSGGVNLTLRQLLEDMSALEAEAFGT